MQIEAKDLRLNNYLLVAVEYAKITCISEDGLSLANAKTLYVFEGYNDVEPIILSPDILVKCGFEKLNNAWIIDDGSRSDYWGKIIGKDTFHLFDKSYGNLTGLTYSGRNLPPLQYLHQLQNLFWCLCGKELEIEL